MTINTRNQIYRIQQSHFDYHNQLAVTALQLVLCKQRDSNSISNGQNNKVNNWHIACFRYTGSANYKVAPYNILLLTHQRLKLIL